MLKNKILVFFFLVGLFAKGQYFVTAPGSSTPSGIIPPLELYTCEPGELYAVTFDNFSPYTISNITFDFTLPTGITYDGGFSGMVINGGTPTGAVVTLASSTSSTLSITINNMNTQDKAEIAFNLKAECDAFQHAKSGGSFIPIVNAFYTPSNTGSPQTQSYTLPDIVVKYPDLSITAVYYDNNTFTAPQYDLNDPEVGDSIFRIIRIENGGEPLTNFTYKAKHGDCLEVFGYNLGSTSSQTSGNITYEIVEFQAADFSGIGNNDGIFDRGEVLYVRETAVIKCCNNPNTEHQVMWGCAANNICQFETINLGIIFPPSSPRLVGNSQIIAGANDTLCYGDFNPIGMRLAIQNIGGNAIDSAMDVSISVHQGIVGFNPNYLSTMDLNSLVITKGGSPIPYTLVTTSANNTAICAGPGGINPIGKFDIHLDRIYSGETIILNWNVYTCNNTACNNQEIGMLGWRYSVNYKNRCDNNYSSSLNLGYGHKGLEHGLSPNGNNPGYTIGNQAQTFKFTILESDFNIPRHASDYLKYKVTFPACANFSPSSANLHLRKWDGTILNPTTLTYTGGVAIATFQNSFYNLEQWELVIKVISASCATGGCTANAFEEIKVESFYKAYALCGYEHALGCATARYKRNCQACTEVLKIYDLAFNGMRRETVGLKDLNDDGVPDPGNLRADVVTDPIRIDRASYGDTVAAVYNFMASPAVDVSGSLCGIPIQPPPNYIYFYAKIKNGNLFTLESFDLKVTHYAGNPCAWAATQVDYLNYPHNLYTYPAGDSTVFLIEVDVQQQITNNNWPSYFISAIGKIKFRINDNPAASLTPCPYEFAFYPSATQSSTFNPTHPNLCNIYFGNIDIIGYDFTSYDSQNISFHSCQTANLTETYRFNIGEWFDNNVATNYYPNEYREYGFVDTLIVKTNNSYNILTADINYSRTAGILNQATIPATNILPYLISNTGNQMVFAIGDLFRNSTFPYSDEGYMGTLNLELESTCNSLGVEDSISYEWKFLTNQIIDNCPSTPPQANSHDNLEYNAPDIQMQTSNAVVPVTTNTFSWEVAISNNSNISNASNIWFALDNSFSSINILNVERVGGGANFEPVGSSIPFGVINLTNDHYRLRNLGGGKEIRVKITAEINGCNPDSVRMIVGYDCAGFPASVTTFNCPLTEFMLHAEPKFPNISVNVSSSQNPTDLCDEVTYTFRISNTRLGRAYNVIGDVSLPIYLDYVIGSAEINDPTNPGWVPVTPVVNNGKLTFDVSSMLPGSVGINGLKGVNFPLENYVEVRIKGKSTCNFVSGSKIEFIGKAIAACGLPFESQPLFSDPIDINGANQTHQTQVIVDADWLTPCNASTNVDVRIVNLGPISSWVGDSITMVLPDGIIYETGSYSPLSNAVATPPQISNYAGKQYLRWSLNNLAINTDTASFNIRIKAIPDSIQTCQEKFLYVYSTNQDNVTCSSSGLPCNVNVITGDTLEPIFVEKGNLNILAGSAKSIANPPNGETVIITLDIDNIGPQIDQFVNGNPNPTIISFYEDIDGSGTYTPADALITYDTLLDSIPNGLYTYQDSVNFPSGKACSFIAVIDYLENSCICTSTEYLITNVPMVTNEPDDSVCANIPTLIGYENPIIGYTYSWSIIPNGTHYLNTTNGATPMVTAPNPISGFDTLTYQIFIDRIGCTSLDTINVYVTHSPIADAGLDDTICGDNYTLNGNVPLIVPGQVYTTGAWTVDPTFGNGATGITFNDSSLYNTNVGGLTSGQYKFIWTLDNGYCQGIPDTVLITVYSTNYRVGNDTTLCDQTAFYLDALSLQPGFTGLWSFIPGSQIGTIANTTIENTTLSGLTDGTYSIEWKVSSPGSQCVYRDTINIEVYLSDPPLAGKDSIICGVFNFNLWANTLQYRNIGEWTIDSLSSVYNNVSFSSSSNAQTTVTFFATGEYDLIWSSANPVCGIIYDTVNIIISNPSNAIAGNDTSLCNIDTLKLNGNIPQVGENGYWSASPSNPSLVAFDNVNDPNTVVRNLTTGSYLFEWKVTNQYCDSSIDSIEVIVDTLPISDAGIDSTFCMGSIVTLYGNIVSGNQIGRWKQLDANTPVIYSNVNDPNALLSNLTVGLYQFEWAITNNICDTIRDTVEIQIIAPPTIFAGNDTALCGQYILNLNALALQPGEIGLWCATPGNPSITFDNASIHNTTARNLVVGVNKIVWKVKNDFCDTVTDTLEIIIDTLPVVDAGADSIIICETSTFQLFGNNLSGNQTGVWRQIDNNPPLTFNTSSLPNANISGLQAAVYKLEWAVTNNICDTVRDTILIDVKEAPIALTENDTSFCKRNSFDLNAIITTIQNYHTYSWSLDTLQSTYNNLPIIVNANTPNATVNNLDIGIYYFVLKVNNNYCDSSLDTIVLTINAFPVVDFNQSKTEVCENGCIGFTNLSSVIDSSGSTLYSYNWDFGNGHFSNQKDIQHCYQNAGIYSVKLAITTNNGCSDSLTKINLITIHPNPIANFEFTPYINVNPGTPVQFNDQSLGADSVSYNMGDGNQVDSTSFSYVYQDTGKFHILQKVTTQFGCIDSVYKEIYVKDQVYVVIPNSFTPNGDNTNDIYIPIVLGVDPTSYRFEIYNRWGQLLYETETQGDGWDGKHKGKHVPTGTYIWKLIFKKKGGIRTFERTGHLTLFK